MLTPRKLNQPHSPHHASPTVCLLSYAQLNDDAVLARAVVAESTEQVQGTGDPIYPGIAKLRRMDLKTDVSKELHSGRDLTEAGLFTSGQWF